MDPVESTDFDFFDTPRNDTNHESEKDVQKGSKKEFQNSKPLEIPSNSDGVKKTKRSSEQKRPSSSLSSTGSENADYSSDSVSSLSDSQSDDEQSQNSPTKKSSNISTYSSNSSGSESPRSQQEDGRKTSHGNRKQRRSDSDDNSSQLSKSTSASGSNSRSSRNGKSRESYRGSKNTKAGKKMSKREPLKEEDDCSSSAYSDGEETSRGITDSYSDKRSNPLDNKRQEAWGADNKSRGKGSGSLRKDSQDRPKTAKQRKGNRERYNRSPSPRSDSEALSDSDITDVSPMDSPRNQGRRSKASHSGINAAGDGANVKAKFRALPIREEDVGDEDDLEGGRVDSGGIDLKILMKAVGELEKKKRVEANSRRVMFAPMTLNRSDKSNYTFDRSKTHDIDRENDRLLKEIVKQVHADRKKQYFRNPPTPKSKITASAVNRDKEMRRIETDNLNFLKRLQQVKATSTISRNNQLREYDNTKLHGIPIATLHPVQRPGSRRSASAMTDSYSSLGSRTRSLTSLHSVASTVRSTTSSKRSSRPVSATKRMDFRPEWNDRW